MPSSEAPALFGYLEEDGCDDPASGRFEILDGRELLIGRDYKTCNVTLTDPTVSNQHLLIYTIAYTEDNHQRIFVYAKDLSTNGTYWRYKHGNHWKELLIGKGSAVLLSDGDKIRLCNGSSFAFRITDRKLGSGAYGEVWMAVDIFRQRQMACKVVKLDKSPQKWTGKVNLSGTLWREVDLLKNITHPNILHVERVFFSEEKLYIISELVTGGDLMSYIERPWASIHDAEACFIVYQILKALEYLHRQGICHRDLKPENVLMSTPVPGTRVILADFGHATKLSDGKKARSRRMKTASVGTDYYVAPEVRGKKKNIHGYTMAADMWSIGIITALLLTGESVFEDSKNEYFSPAAVSDAAAECDLAKMVHSPLWQSVNNLAQDFVRNLLILDEEARLNADQALKHEWFTDCKRKKEIQQKYEDAIRGWMPSRPLLDFKEDLAVFREANNCTLDSILMPPPPKPNLNRFLSRPLYQLQSGQQLSPFFSRAVQDTTTKLVPLNGQNRELESDDGASMPSSFPKQTIPGNKRPNHDSRGKNKVQSETKKPANNSAKQIVVGKHETLFQFESSRRTQRPSTDLDYEERRLHDRASREEASIFMSAKSYGQCVEKRRRLGD
ncbi:MAG: hypothetical protein ASARMPRED_001122 [Alectoria sarmentosa]|nr:MAG: hypothetical protein ASARMPRED_001122 [Alectoria sarmentosa]